jgi:nucleoside-diphosphate-sugar epimerase
MSKVMSSARQILVTGAGGFVCGNAIDALLASGYQVIGLDQAFDADLKRDWQTRWGDQLRLIEIPVTDLPALRVDAIIHGAAITAAPDEVALSPEGYWRANLDPTLTLLEWARDRCAGRFIFLSSSAVFRETNAGPVEETLPAAPLGLYAAAKHATEHLLETLRAQHGRDVIAARLSNIYGPRERSRPTRPHVSLVGHMVETAVARRNIIVYAQEPARDWTFAPDIGAALIALLEAPALAHALYHVASQQVLTPQAIAQTIQEILPDVEIDLRPGIDPQRPPLTRRGYLSSARLREATGFDGWTPFAEGLRQTVAWCRQKKEFAS